MRKFNIFFDLCLWKTTSSESISYFQANVGDSRAIAGINGSYKVLSLDHKPSKEIERRRILAAGGFVSYNRVNGHLATSRALGDFKYKKNKQLGPETQIVTGR